MGYVEKMVLMETLRTEGSFSQEELSIIDKAIIEDKIYDNEAVMSLKTLNDFEANGILERFYIICKKHSFFPMWLDNVKKRSDHI